MSDRPAKVRCTRCTMTFSVLRKYPTNTEALRCPDCGMAFTSATIVGSAHCRAYIRADEAERCAHLLEEAGAAAEEAAA